MAARQELVLGGARALRKQFDRQARWSRATVWVGAGLVGAVALAGILAGVLAPYKPNTQNLLEAFQAPSGSHLFGTDQYGRDIFSRSLYAIRVDLVFGLVTTFVPMVLGMALGAIAGYYRGWRESVIMRLVDITIALPFIVLVLAIVAIVGPGIKGVYIGVTIVSWALYARLTRAEMLVLREQQFIMAARALGLSTPRILLRHALPNAMGPVLSVVALNLGYLISGVAVIEVVFSYPGLGRLMVDSISYRDMPLIQTTAMIFCTLYIFFNFVADLSSVLLNPRLMHAS